MSQNQKLPESKQKGQNDSKPVEQPEEPKWWVSKYFILFLLVIAFLPWLWGWFFGGGLAETTEISYSTFRQQLRDGNVEQITIQGDRITGMVKEPVEEESSSNEDETKTYTEFVTYLPSFGDDSLLSLLERQEVTVETQPESDFSVLGVIFNLLPFLLLIFIGFALFRGMRSQGQNLFSIGKSRAQLYERTEERTTFDDVAGAEGAKTELREIIEYLKNPERVQRLGGEAPKGVLLVGPPGTGKTLLARAVAGEADAPFFSISGSDFMEMFVGVGASRVRDLFVEAKRAAPGIIFIDELDSIGRRRGTGLGGGHDEREQTLNQLLSELDGFQPNESVIVMAATNRPDILDPALLRPGRFDRRITVDLPTAKSRVGILKIHAQNKPLADELDLEELARSVPGFSGADLKNMLNESALLAARQGKEEIQLEDIEAARDKILMGLKREGLALTEQERELIAYHEAGHAVVAAVLPHADPVHKVTIIPRGRAMGVTQQLPEQEKYIYPREYMLDRLAVMMGGRVAENLIFQTATSGAENDLKQATHLARKMVLDWGMSERFERIAWGSGRQQVFLGEELTQRRAYSEITARELDEAIKEILEAAYEKADTTLREYQHALSDVAKALLEREEISGEEVLKFVNGISQKTPIPSDNNRVREAA